MQNSINRIQEESANDDNEHLIQCRILQEYSCAEIAKRLIKKDGTVRMLQYWAIKEFAKSLNELT